MYTLYFQSCFWKSEMIKYEFMKKKTKHKTFYFKYECVMSKF